MTAEQLEELLAAYGQDENINNKRNALGALQVLAPSLARRVIAAERMAEALKDLIDYCGSSQMGCSTRDEEAALSAYREASK